MGQMEKLNELYEKHKGSISGQFHNCLWQVMVNNSLQNADAAFLQQCSQECVSIALGEGGYITTMFKIEDKDREDEIIDDLNEQVFGVTHEGAWNVVVRSMTKRVP